MKFFFKLANNVKEKLKYLLNNIKQVTQNRNNFNLIRTFQFHNLKYFLISYSFRISFLHVIYFNPVTFFHIHQTFSDFLLEPGTRNTAENLLEAISSYRT